MNELLPVLGWGFAVSFLGQLPLGNLNVAATQIGVEENFKNAWLFSIAGAIVEVVYLRIALSSSGWLMHNKMLFNYVSWFTVILFYTLGFLSIRKAILQKEPQKKGLLIDNNINRHKPYANTLLVFLGHLFYSQRYDKTDNVGL